MKRFLTASVLALSLTACGEVPTGHRGIWVNYGKPTGTVSEGLHWYNPWSYDLEVMNVKQKKWESQTEAYTLDVQQATIQFALTYQLDPNKALWMIQNVGRDDEWPSAIVPQVVEQSIKDVIGRARATQDVINNQAVVQQRILSEIRKRLKTRNVIAIGFEMKDVAFSPAFEKAVEQKQIAVERANAAKNKTVEVEELARQRVMAAEADAKAMQIKTQALSGNAKLVEYEAVQRWDGKLPQNMYGGNMPFIMAK